ncbi:ATP-binding protein [Geminicoccaceae bacterium 1502E]|nr:ATP-binding protein [Geminicoccaceae bacterium 1502E]
MSSDGEQGRGAPEALPALKAAAVFALPTAAAVGVSWLAGSSVLAASAAAAAGAAAALALGWVWADHLGRLARWARSLGDGRSGDRPDPLPGSSLEWLTWPVLDITRRMRRAERREAMRGRALDALIRALPDPILVIDTRHQIRLANPAAMRAFNLPREEGLPLGRALRDPGILAAVEAALAGGAGGSAVYNPVSDRLKQFHVQVEPLEVGEGTRRALVTLREQTEQLMIERMRSDFVANASHEIRTPLASLIGFIETLRGPAKNDPAAAEAFLETMADEAGRMARLVDDLLSLSQIELAENRPPDSLVEIDLVLLRVADAMQPAAHRARLELVLDLEEDLPSLPGDADQLRQLFTNLVDNAVKYGGAGTEVRIEARRLENADSHAGPLSGRPRVEVCVVDQGEGIAAEHLPRLTERFYRVDKPRSRQLGGTGLGLAIVKHIVRRHHGHLRVESELGRGSRFCVGLPLRGG